MSTAVASGRARGGEAWRGYGWLLPASTALLLVVATGIAFADAEPVPHVTVAALAAGFGGWQTVWRPWRRRLCGATAAAVVWGLGTIWLWLWLTSIHGVFHLLLFAVFALLFFATDLPVGAGLAVVLGAAVGLVNLPAAPTAADAAVAVILLVVTATVATGIGAWIHGIIGQSHQRAQLIAELDATRAELAEAERSAGAQAERDRLAAEIHDTLAQGFTSIVLLLEAVREHVAARQSAADEAAGARAALRRLDLAVETARINLAEARHLVADLGPAALVDTSLPDAVRRAAQHLGEVLGVVVDVRIDGHPRRLAAEDEVALLRVVQESLSNVERHADAGGVTVVLCYDAGGDVTLEVRDDGRGFDQAVTPQGHGLCGMDRRLIALGGEVAVTSAPGRGTRVQAQLP